MFDDIDQRPCPHCGRSINCAATRCGFCWSLVTPEVFDEAAIPYSNHREAFRLAQNRDCAAIEALLDERDRLREEVAAAARPAVITGQREDQAELAAPRNVEYVLNPATARETRAEIG